MSGYLVQVLVDDITKDLDSEIELVQAVAVHVLQAQEQPDKTELSVLLTTDERIRELNRTFRDTDAPTDVLSFAALEGQPFVLPEGEPVNLGDIVISMQSMQRQAVQAGRCERDELALLVVHGCLHLLGYDHAGPDEEREMWRIQDSLLTEMGFASGPVALQGRGGSDES